MKRTIISLPRKRGIDGGFHRNLYIEAWEKWKKNGSMIRLMKRREGQRSVSKKKKASRKERRDVL